MEFRGVVVDRATSTGGSASDRSRERSQSSVWEPDPEPELDSLELSDSWDMENSVLVFLSAMSEA